MTSGAMYAVVPMKVLLVRYLLHWLEEAEAERMLKDGVEGTPQETALSPLSSGTFGRVGLRRGDHESASTAATMNLSPTCYSTCNNTVCIGDITENLQLLICPHKQLCLPQWSLS